jgi:hypothetical protein
MPLTPEKSRARSESSSEVSGRTSKIAAAFCSILVEACFDVYI